MEIGREEDFAAVEAPQPRQRVDAVSRQIEITGAGIVEGERHAGFRPWKQHAGCKPRICGCEEPISMAIELGLGHCGGEDLVAMLSGHRLYLAMPRSTLTARLILNLTA